MAKRNKLNNNYPKRVTKGVGKKGQHDKSPVKELLTARWDYILNMVENIMESHDIELDIKSQYPKWINSTLDIKPPCYQCPGTEECAITARECTEFEKYCQDKSSVRDQWYLMKGYNPGCRKTTKRISKNGYC